MNEANDVQHWSKRMKHSLPANMVARPETLPVSALSSVARVADEPVAKEGACQYSSTKVQVEDSLQQHEKQASTRGERSTSARTAAPDSSRFTLAFLPVQTKISAPLSSTKVSFVSCLSKFPLFLRVNSIASLMTRQVIELDDVLKLVGSVLVKAAFRGALYRSFAPHDAPEPVQLRGVVILVDNVCFWTCTSGWRTSQDEAETEESEIRCGLLV